MPGILDTPQKAQILGALRLARHLRKTQGLVYSQDHIADLFGVHRNTVVKIKRDDNPRTGPSINGETRGRKRKLTDGHCEAVVQLYDEHPQEAPDMPWDAQLIEACDVEANSETVAHAMRRYGDYGKYIAAEKDFSSPEDCERKVAHCRWMLETYDQADFLTFRYTDESHFGWKQKTIGRHYISRKKGQRAEPRNTRERPAPEDPIHDERVHTWAGIGYQFKSDLIRYYPTNKNGKMSLKVYLEQILKPHVGEWLESGDDFVLFEDNDSGHGTSAHNIVRTWKEAVRLKYLFNAPRAPSINPIENAWRAPDHAVNQNARMCDTADELFAVAEEAWRSNVS